MSKKATASYEAATVETAARRVASMLQRPEQLDKIDVYYQKIESQKMSVEGRLKAELQKQLDDVSTGIENLEIAIESVRFVQLNIDEIMELANTVLPLSERIGDYDKMNRKRRDLLTTRENLHRIFTVPDTVRQLQASMESPSPNLILLHSQLIQLEQCRDELLYHARGLPAEKASLDWHFSEVDQLRNQLQARIWSIMTSVLVNARDNRRAVVTALRIIEREEDIDKRIEALQDSQLSIDKSQRPRRYRATLEDLLAKTVAGKFEKLNEIQDMDKLMDACTNLMYGDLIGVRKYALPCFPPHYDVMYWFGYTYHLEMGKLLDKAALRAHDSPAILAIFKWVHTYKQIMLENVGLNKETFEKLQPPLLYAHTDELLQRYTEIVRVKMEEWKINIIKNEVREYFQQKAVEENSDGLYVTSITIILFQMADQQVTVACKTLHAPVILQVVQQCVAMMMNFQSEFEGVVRKLEDEYYEKPVGQRRAGFFEFMIAVVNNCVICESSAKQLSAQVMEVVDEENRAMCEHQSQAMVDCFMELGANTVKVLVGVICGDLEPAMAKLFSDEYYKKKNYIANITATVEDYFNDLKAHMHAHFRPFLFSKVRGHVLYSYLTRVFAKHAPLKPSHKVDLKIAEDGKRLTACFKKFAFDEAEAHEVEQLFSVLQDISGMVGADDALTCSSFFKLYTEYDDFTYEHMERLVKNRSSSKVEAARIIEDLRGMNVKKKKLDPEKPPLPIFSQIALNTKD